MGQELLKDTLKPLTALQDYMLNMHLLWHESQKQEQAGDENPTEDPEPLITWDIGWS